MNIRYYFDRNNLTEFNLQELFSSVGWDSAKDSKTLKKAFLASSHLVTAWDNTKLVGIIRSMDDNCWSANIDCLVVHSDYQRLGIGTKLVENLLNQIDYIKYINVSPDESDNSFFYKKFGFEVIKGGVSMQKNNDMVTL